MTHVRLLGLSRLLVLAVACNLAASAQGAKFIGLGDLPGGSFYSIANGISANGSVVVGDSVSASGQEAYRWTYSGGMIDLGGGAFQSRADGVSADGSVVVGYNHIASGPEAFRWTSGGGMVGLGDLPGGGLFSVAYDVSADGSVLVGQGASASGTEAFRWTSGGGMVGLGDLPGGGFYSFANDVSADGSVVVGYSSSTLGNEAFRWTSSGGMVGLGDLPGGEFESSAAGVSADGSIVVGIGSSASGIEPFVWDAVHGMRSVRDLLLPSVGAALNGWTFYATTGVSADGRTIVGYGTNPIGQLEGWLAYLPAEIYWFPNTSGNWDSSANWSGPFAITAADDVVIDPTVAATITGPTAHTTIRSLSIGGSGVGRVTLSLNSPYSGDLHVSTYAEVHPNGELVLAYGRNFSAGNLLYNSGVIRGTGTVNADLLNYAAGEVRVASGESLVISGGGHTNSGKLEAIGGSLEFVGAVNNSTSTGLITGQSATLRFNGGLTNDGSMALTAGMNNVSGDIANNAGGKITVTGGASAVFYDDVVQNGTLRVVKVGSTTSTAVFLGAFTGSGGSTGDGDIFFEGDLRPGNSPASVTFGNNVGFGSDAMLKIELGGTLQGAQYDHVQVTGQLSLDGTLLVSLINGFTPTAGQSFDILGFNLANLSGTFSSITLPTLTGGQSWNTSNLYTTGVLSVVGPLVPGDFDSDGDVDGADFVAWQTNFPTSTGATLAQGDADSDGDVDGADFVVWQTHFPFTPGPATVPEPSTIALTLLSVPVFFALFRRRR